MSVKTRLGKAEGVLESRRKAVIGELMDEVWMQPTEVQQSFWRWVMPSIKDKDPDTALLLCGARLEFEPSDAANIDAVLKKVWPRERFAELARLWPRNG